MSAIVTIPNPNPESHHPVHVAVPKGNGFEIDEEGRLIVKSSAWGGDPVACFTQWKHIVIEPDRGPDGRFVKRGS